MRSPARAASPARAMATNIPGLAETHPPSGGEVAPEQRRQNRHPSLTEPTASALDLFLLLTESPSASERSVCPPGAKTRPATTPTQTHPLLDQNTHLRNATKKRTDGRTDERTDGRTDGRTNERTTTTSRDSPTAPYILQHKLDRRSTCGPLFSKNLPAQQCPYRRLETTTTETSPHPPFLPASNPPAAMAPSSIPAARPLNRVVVLRRDQAEAKQSSRALISQPPTSSV